MTARISQWRGAIAAVLTLAVVIGATQAASRLPLTRVTLPSLPEPPGFAITPTGTDVPRLAPVTVTFPAEPSEREGDKLLLLEPALKGTYAWLSTRTLLFQPGFPGFTRGATYTVTVPGGSDTGMPAPIKQKFTVTGLLTVQQAIPSDGDTEVPLNAQVIVQFSRSVAPLTTLAAQPTEKVVTFDPPLDGKGEWLNTSIYRFIPRSLAPATTYVARVAKGLTSAVDGVLQDDVTWSFSTVTPGVATILPEDNFLFASPRQQVTVTFNQPMDATAANGIFVRARDGDAVRGSVTWDPTRTTATFTPADALERDTVYVVSAEKGLKGARGGATSALRTSSFRTAAPLRIVQTFPGNGETSAGRFGVNLRFNNPMQRDTLEGKLRISGFSDEDLKDHVFVEPGQLVTGQQAFAGGIFANLQLKPSTSYTVDLLPGARDVYGSVSQGYSWSFTTGALPSQVTFALSGFSQSATFAANAEPRLYFRTTNLPSASFTLWPLTDDEARAMLHGPPPCCGAFRPSRDPLRKWTEKVDDVKDDVVLSSTSLSGGGPLPKGYYYVRTDGAQIFSQLTFAVVDTEIVTKLSTEELLVWAIDHETGTPVPGVSVKASGAFQTSATAASRSAVTNADGLATFEVAVPRIGDNYDRSFFVTTDGSDRFGVGSTRWNPGISPFQFNLPSEFFAREWVGQLYTDRPIYRPGETVDLKGIVRRDDDARYTLPAQAPLQLVITNARGQQVRTDDVALSEFGTFGGTFGIPADAPLGDYQIRIRVDPKVPKGGYDVAFSSFRVAEFRAPEYQVQVTTARPSYTDGERMDARTSATFFFGGALAAAPVQWTAMSQPYAMRVPGYERYSFTDADVFRQAVQRTAVRASGKTATDASGNAAFAVPAALAPGEGAQQFTISATVTDQNGQAVAASTTATVHPASVYAGVHPAQYVATQGASAAIDLVTVDTSGGISGGRAVKVRIYDRQWITTKEELPGGGRKYTSTPKDTLLETLDATTSPKGEARVRFTPSKPGSLRVVAEATDSAGRTSRSATYLWVAGKEFAYWQVTNDDAMQLVADKDQYEVGDTAEILVPAPFVGATGLVTVERGKIMTREVRTFATNSERIRVPITDRAIPNVFVSVVLYRGPTAEDPTPRFKVGYVKLPVSTSPRQLSVKITPDRERTKPGETVRYDIAVTDRSGRPVRAELSVAVVDKAVLSLEEERGPDGLHAFWFERGLAVSTASSISISMDRTNDALAEAPKVGKGGSGSGLQNDQTRKDFRNTAFWNARVTTGDDGRASVNVAMPDNLTTWRLQARAVSGDTMVGEGVNELLSTEPLLVRPALPRFLRVGDTFDLRALVRNATTKDATVEVRLVADGVNVKDGAPRGITIRPDESVLVSWPAAVTREGTAKITFTASGSGLQDAVTLSVPMLLDVTPEAMATGGIVTAEPMQEAIYLPPFARTDRGSVSVDVRSTLVGALRDELRELAPPIIGTESTERIASRLIATIGVRRAEKSALGSSTQYDGRIGSDFAALIGRQRPDGGWAWCEDPLCSSDPYVTSWVLFAIGEAKKDGMTVDATAMSRAGSYVLAYVGTNNAAAPVPGKGPQPLPVTAFRPIDPSDKAQLYAGLANVGLLSASTARALLEQERARLANYGRAALILALSEIGAPDDDPAVRALVNDLNAAALPTANGDHWEDEVRGRFLTNTATTALGTLALARVNPEHALLPQTVRWLVYARGVNKWETSVARATSVLALTKYVVGTGELGGEYGWTVRLSGAELLAGLTKKGETSSGSTQIPLGKVTPGQVSVLEFAKDKGSSGRLYYKLDLRYTTPAQEVEAVNRGFAVSHQYTTLDDPATPLSRVKVGETVRVSLTVMVPADRKYVVVEDLLPAGLEPVDARLRTVDPALKAKLEADRQSAAQKDPKAGYFAPWLRWYYSPWQRTELRDDRALLFADQLAKGVYEFVYYARATTPGDFFVAPAHAEESYFPDVFGRSDSTRFVVTR